LRKVKTSFFCQNCGAQSPKWLGRCTSCGEWNTYVEEVIESPGSARASWTTDRTNRKTSKPVALSEINYNDQKRIVLRDRELSRVLGGGIVPGSVVLFGGEPGIGKSTLMLQVALQLKNNKVLYVSGEESEQQIKMRAERMDSFSENCYILSETSTQNIFKQIELLKPELLIIDSIQTLNTSRLDSASGSISQVRECASELMKFAKETGTPVFLIGHITKDGMLAGPKVLEHMVDTVLQFEGDRHNVYRILRTTKNRFGSSSELGIYEMNSLGLKEVPNPSEILLSQRENSLSGVTIGATLEGNRPLLIEIQSLVSPATYGTPQRSSTGFDYKRLNMLLAVLEKRGGHKLTMQDVFLNIAGGLKVDDPALDLAVVVSIISSLQDIPVNTDICFAAEVGLGGEIRSINRVENRISEAAKLGFKNIYISKFNQKNLSQNNLEIEVIAVSKLNQVLSVLF